MTFIKTSIITTCNAIHSFTPGAATCNTSYKCLSTRDVRYYEKRYQGHRRRYATITGDSREDLPDVSWPEAPKGQSCPTPYQIFAISRTAPYSKARFYELVKLYHPDRNNSAASCSHATKLERYRLIVAAHTILSDPVKRSAYDRFGAGWAGKADSPSTSPYANSQAHPGPFTSGSWREHDPNIWANATWEDWERWRDKQEGEAREPQSVRYLQNSTFVSLLLVFAAVGSSLNYNRAEAEGGRFLAARDAVHDQASKELRKVRQSTHQRPKDERIDWFLKNREAAMLGIGVDELRDEKARHILSPQETCMPEGMNKDGD
ncbi:DnaJ domain-containing protein 2 [Elsinoe fawcettii]|nr:DnaJ domain-containing protein 2 [Elsinoe fawcettii]